MNMSIPELIVAQSGAVLSVLHTAYYHNDHIDHRISIACFLV